MYTSDQVAVKGQASIQTNTSFVFKDRFDAEFLLMMCVCADVHRNELLQEWPAHLGQVLQVQYSVDETSIFSVGEDGIVSYGPLALLY